MTEQEERCWRFLIENRSASAERVAEACGVDVEYAGELIARISTEDWRTEIVPKLEGKKFDAAKPRHDLIPPELPEVVAQVLTFGAAKYGPRNWENGMAWGRPFAALMRHMWAWWRGETHDPETGMSHLWHAACCIAFLVAYEARNIGEDDRPGARQ